MLDAIYNIACTMPFAICMTWFAILVIEYKRNDPAKRMLTIFAAVCTILYLCHAINYLGGNNNAIDAIWMACSLASYPVFWLYIKRITKSENKSISELWVLIPAVVLSLLSLVTTIDIIEKVVAIATILLVCIFGYSRLNSFDRKVSNYYSDTSERSMKPIMTIMVFLVLASIGSAVLNVIGRAIFNNSLMILIPSAAFSALLFGILYSGSRLVYSGNEVNEKDPTIELIKLTEKQEEDLMTRIDKLMIEQKLFTSKGLKITDISNALGTNRTYVSNCINESTGKSFSTYVNEMRIEYAKDLLKKNKNTLTISEIADMSGYTNEASFYRNFKLYTSITPSDWLEQLES